MACLQYPLVSRNRGFGKGSGIDILAVGSCPSVSSLHDVWHILQDQRHFERLRKVAGE